MNLQLGEKLVKQLWLFLCTGHGSVSNLEKTAYVLGFFLLIMVRIPNVLLKGRFWAEDGHVFFANAWCLPWYQALFNPFGGYLNLLANLAGILAKNLVPLYQAPYVPSIIALLVQTIPAILLCSSRQNWLQNRKILLAALLLIVLSPMSLEIWLCAVNSHFHLDLSVALILALDTESGAICLFQYFVIGLAALSDPSGILLWPLFLTRAIVDRSSQRAKQAAVLGLVGAVQLLVFCSIQRTLGIQPLLFLSIFFVKHLAIPFFGPRCANYLIGDRLFDAVTTGHVLYPVLVAATAAIVILALAIWRNRRREPAWFFLSAIFIAVVSYYGALGDRAELLRVDYGNRYAFAPQVLFEFAILSLACVSSGWLNRISRFVIIWFLIVCALEYSYIPDLYGKGANWQAEVRHWNFDRHHSLNIWPVGWSVKLETKEVSK